MRRSKEMFRTTAHRRGRRRAPARREAGPRRNYGQVARHHASAAQLRTACRPSRDPARTEVTCVDGGHRAENVVVMNVGDIREARSGVQRREAAEAVKPATEANYAKAASVSTPPRMEPVARPDRKPTEASPTTKTKSEAKARAPSPERNI